MGPDKIIISEKLKLFADHWHPRIIAELNGQQVKLVKFQGEFVWHKHEKEDELFFVLQGEFFMEFRDKTVKVSEGELLIVPSGVEHKPKAKDVVSVMLFEPSGTLNTGTTIGELTHTYLERI
jgi:mannose-6-phosphate isomerase-like protein (cupin superfamily)